MGRDLQRGSNGEADNDISLIQTEISYDEKKVLELMRVFDLSYMELVFLFQEGLRPAIHALGKYKNPPWSRETIPEMDEYYDELTDKYEALYEFFEEGKNELH